MPEEELKQYISLSAVQTKGLKRHLREAELETLVNSVGPSKNDDSEEPVVNSLKGSKKRRLAILHKGKQKNKVEDLNTLDVDVSYQYTFY